MTHLTGFPCPPVRRGSRSGAWRTVSGPQRSGRSREPGLRWRATARRVRCGPCPAGIAPRAAPARRAAARHQMGHYHRSLV